ncbi:alpha/beta fold hydrolase [Nonomuraea antimicrobica]|uniref:Alpha/beta fold hydrolase n=1 Tax=Nonomuraea antimicrobica TaxID=561173 RepID=A0ABP7B3F9_9ACTN
MPSDREAARWIRCFDPVPRAEVRLVCFPHAGGVAGFYRPLSTALSPSFEVLAVQYPGRQDRFGEPFPDDLDELSDRLAGVLRQAGEVVFLGHSMGAIVAFEVARRLDRPPTELFVSGTGAPGRQESARMRDGDALAAMGRLGGTDAAILQDRELRELILPILQGDLRLMDAYRYSPGAPLACPITALTGDADPLTTVDDARLWSRHTSGRFRLRIFRGGHFYLTDQWNAVAAAVAGSPPVSRRIPTTHDSGR